METDLSATLQEKLDALTPLFDQDQCVLGVWLFGSQADGMATEQSDIDLAVLFDRELDINEELAFEVAVSEALKTDDVDVLNLNKANLGWQFRAIAGKMLYERDFVRVSDFVEETLIQTRDFYHRAQSMLRDSLEITK